MFDKLNNKSEYSIIMPGIDPSSIGYTLIDEKYCIVGQSPEHIAALVTLKGNAEPSFDNVLFFANCLSFENEVPTFVDAAKCGAYYRPILNGPKAFNQLSFYAATRSTYESISELKLGLGAIVCRYSQDSDTIKYFSRVYELVQKEIGLYAMAQRQIDPFSEYVNYYRIIESISSGGNGKKWIDNNINRIKTYEFGFLEIEDLNAKSRLMRKRRINVYTCYRRRAVKRIAQLVEEYSLDILSRYFYNIARCGIAHGNDIIEFDFKENVMNIAEDNIIMRLLSRIAIEEKARGNGT